MIGDENPAQPVGLDQRNHQQRSDARIAPVVSDARAPNVGRITGWRLLIAPAKKPLRASSSPSARSSESWRHPPRRASRDRRRSAGKHGVRGQRRARELEGPVHG